MFSAFACSSAVAAPNVTDAVARPLRYRPDGRDFVSENGTEFFNRPLYPENGAFRVDTSDRPECSFYLPGRGGNLRIGLKSGAGAKWLIDAAKIEARYRPVSMLYEIHDPHARERDAATDSASIRGHRRRDPTGGSGRKCQ